MHATAPRHQHANDLTTAEAADGSPYIDPATLDTTALAARAALRDAVSVRLDPGTGQEVVLGWLVKLEDGQFAAVMNAHAIPDAPQVVRDEGCGSIGHAWVRVSRRAQDGTLTEHHAVGGVDHLARSMVVVWNYVHA